MRRSVILPAAAALLCAGAWRAFAAPQIDFDQGANVPAVLEAVQEQAAAAPAHIDEGTRYRAEFDRWDRDCATISFGKDDPLRSERVLLESRQYQERCYPAGPRGERNCHEEWTHTERRSVTVRITGRGGMLPWERDVFRVCLDGYWLNAYVSDASHEYQLNTPGGWDGGEIEAVAGRKVASEADPAGVIAQGLRFSGDTGNFVLQLKDRWAGFYEGEAVGLEIRLVRYHKNWFDSTVLKKELELPVADAYTVDFAEFADELKGKLQKGKTYYVKWRFKRVGKVSKRTWKGYWESQKAVFGEASAAAADFQAQATLCFLSGMEKDQCVYKCRDGSMTRRPMDEPDPFGDGLPTVACPQVLLQF